MSILKRIVTSITTIIMSIVLFSATASAFYGPLKPTSSMIQTTFYGEPTTRIYHTSFQFKTSKNVKMSCIVSAYADSNIEIEVYGETLQKDDTFGKIYYNKTALGQYPQIYADDGGYTRRDMSDVVEFTFYGMRTGNSVPHIAVLVNNIQGSRFLNKTIWVFGRRLDINFQNIFTEIADIDNDGSVTIDDALSVLQDYTNNRLLGNGGILLKGDMDKDGLITIDDALDIMNMYTQVSLLQ